MVLQPTKVSTKLTARIFAPLVICLLVGCSGESQSNLSSNSDSSNPGSESNNLLSGQYGVVGQPGPGPVSTPVSDDFQCCVDRFDNDLSLEHRLACETHGTVAPMATCERMVCCNTGLGIYTPKIALDCDAAEVPFDYCQANPLGCCSIAQPPQHHVMSKNQCQGVGGNFNLSMEVCAKQTCCDKNGLIELIPEVDCPAVNRHDEAQCAQVCCDGFTVPAFPGTISGPERISRLKCQQGFGSERPDLCEIVCCELLQPSFLGRYDYRAKGLCENPRTGGPGVIVNNIKCVQEERKVCCQQPGGYPPAEHFESGCVPPAQKLPDSICSANNELVCCTRNGAPPERIKDYECTSAGGTLVDPHYCDSGLLCCETLGENGFPRFGFKSYSECQAAGGIQADPLQCGIFRLPSPPPLYPPSPVPTPSVPMVPTMPPMAPVPTTMVPPMAPTSAPMPTMMMMMPPSSTGYTPPIAVPPMNPFLNP